MRPDEDKILKEMGISKETCDKCLMELYTDADDTVCDDCKLNPMNNGTSGARHFEAAAAHEGSFSLSEIKERNKKMKKKK